MARENNYLLGSGERLAHAVQVPRGGGKKNPPYDLATAKARIADRLVGVRTEIERLPADACPRDQAVAIMTMHPRYVSKTDFPSTLLSSLGLRALGSRSRAVRPEQWGIERHEDTAVTDDIFVSGPRTAFVRWAETVTKWRSDSPGADQLGRIEDIAPFEARSKLRSIPDGEQALLEVVLHNGGSDDIVLSFLRYAQARGAEPLIDRRRDVRGLTFVPVRVAPQRAEEIAAFSFVRVARGMPSMRPVGPTILRSATTFAIGLPGSPAVDIQTRTVIYDGGIPAEAQAGLAPWVTAFEADGVGAPVPQFEEHGLAVTSAFLFGPLRAGEATGLPMCRVDHVRVLDTNTGANNDIEYFDVLDRITAHLDKNLGTYSFVNISLGPSLPAEDDEVTLWTASLDKRFANGACLTTVAAGNDGDRDPLAGLNRIQPPADAVNVLSVGAADRADVPWGRADYSCVGPGRRPGVVKPDGVAFGGTNLLPFGVLSRGLLGRGDWGTSFAAPLALRSAAAVRAQLGVDSLSPLAIRALLIHRATRGDSHDWKEVGWGRFESNLVRLITCDDDETVVVFQGYLPVSDHLRAPIPIPRGALKGAVTISATLVIAPEVDPENPSAYTRSGLEVAFRPHKARFAKGKGGRVPKHPKTRPFFSASLQYGKAEALLRESGTKWEPCLRNQLIVPAKNLDEPAFDIYYHHRDAGTAHAAPQPIPYALVVGVRTPDVPDLYDRVVRAYANVLVPIQPQVRLQVQV